MPAQGLRPVQLWVPDTRTADFRAEAHRQATAVALSAPEPEDQGFIDAVSDRTELPPMSRPPRWKFPLQLPISLKETVMRLAKDDGVSLNQWILSAVAQKIGAAEAAEEFLERRAANAKPGDLTRHLDDAPDRPPAPAHELPKA